MTNASAMNKKNGTTLTETMMAVGFVAFCIGSILAVIIQSVDLRQSTENISIAVDIARSRIERIREVREEQGYGTLSTLVESDTLVDNLGQDDPNGNFKRTTAVDTNYGTAGYPLTKVTVTVQYKRRSVFSPIAGVRTIQIATLLSQYM